MANGLQTPIFILASSLTGPNAGVEPHEGHTSCLLRGGICRLSAVMGGESGVKFATRELVTQSFISYQSLYHTEASQVGLTRRVLPYLCGKPDGNILAKIREKIEHTCGSL